MNMCFSVQLCVLVCSCIVWYMPSAAASLASTSSESNLQLSPVDQYLPSYTSSSSSASSLPNRSDVISTLFDYYLNYSSSDDNSRKLQTAKFASLNKLFAQVSLKLPDAKVTKSGLDLTITQLVCRNLNIRDIVLAHSIQSDTSQRLNLKIQGLKINCTFLAWIQVCQWFLAFLQSLIW